MSKRINGPLAVRFQARVDHNGPIPAHMPHLGPCWLWTAARTKAGYGLIGKGSRLHYAHRLAWEWHHGKEPGRLRVLHQCDNPACVRPSHLFIGTQGDNVADMLAKGRQASKLSADQVRKIRLLRLVGIPRAAVAATFDITTSMVSAITNRRNWAHVA